MYLASNLKYLREKKREKQVELAEMLEISRSTYGLWETGDRSPSIENMIALADHFCITVDDLIRKDLRPQKPMCATNLQYLREENGFNQKEIADLIKTKHSIINKYESGMVEIPLIKVIQLAEFFGVTLDQFVKQDLSEVEHEKKK